MRAFRTTFLCAIDENEAVDNDQRETGVPVTLEEVKRYLSDALRLSFDDEQCGNPIGLQSLEVHIEQLEELPQNEVEKLYEKGH